jgi:hypothetical protein
MMQKLNQISDNGNRASRQKTLLDSPESPYKPLKKVKTYNNMANIDLLELASNKQTKAQKKGGSLLNYGFSAGKVFKALANLLARKTKTKDVRVY